MPDLQIGMRIAKVERGGEYSMLKGIYETASGMLPQMQRLDTVSNNLANANTAGFKRELVFSREFAKAQQVGTVGQADWEQPGETGLITDFSQGSIEQTGNSFDLALDGDGFFVVATPDGEMYTRNGNFTLMPDGTLVTSDGYPVQSNGRDITVDGDEFVVNRTGEMTVDGRPVGQLQLVTFDAPYPLARTAPGLYAPLPNAPGPATAENVAVHQGALERANVDVITEMVRMIESFRNFETGQRMIQIQDESLGKAINQLGSVRR